MKIEDDLLKVLIVRTGFASYKGQIIRAKIDIESGVMEFYQIKIAVDDSTRTITITYNDLDDEDFKEIKSLLLRK